MAAMAAGPAIEDRWMAFLQRHPEAFDSIDILDDLGDKALEYFESVEKDLLSVEELSRYVKLLSQIGEVRRDQGNLEAALEALDNADRQGDAQLAPYVYWGMSLVRRIIPLPVTLKLSWSQ